MVPKRIVLGTTSAHKLAELRSVANSYGSEIVSLTEIQAELGLPPLGEIIEDGSSFSENAEIKARAVLAWCGMPSLGDDSGLEVEALGGGPGIYSARYAGPGATDADRIAKLLSELKEVAAPRRAKFRCSLCLLLPTGQRYVADGELQGEVLHAPRGDHGFGYDPVIHLYALTATLAEVDFSVTCSDGFRARAAKALFRQLS